MALTKAKIKEMQQYSLFITEDQLRATITAHLERAGVWLSPATMKVLDVLRANS
jgi:hypothetical protein